MIGSGKVGGAAKDRHVCGEFIETFILTVSESVTMADH
jgi:hypothetical protein